jgi:hypothetical protein
LGDLHHFRLDRPEDYICTHSNSIHLKKYEKYGMMLVASLFGLEVIIAKAINNNLVVAVTHLVNTIQTKYSQSDRSVPLPFHR